MPFEHPFFCGAFLVCSSSRLLLVPYAHFSLLMQNFDHIGHIQWILMPVYWWLDIIQSSVNWQSWEDARPKKASVQKSLGPVNSSLRKMWGKKEEKKSVDSWLRKILVHGVPPRILTPTLSCWPTAISDCSNPDEGHIYMKIDVNIDLLNLGCILAP